MSVKGDGSRTGVQSVARTLDLLEALADPPGSRGVSELAVRTGLPQATIHRLLATLVDRGYVRQDPETRRYGLGGRVLRLAAGAEELLGATLRPYLAELVAVSGETANLAALEQGSVVYVAQAPSPHRMRMFTEVGNRVPAHSTAVGKVLLAHRPRTVVEQLLDHGLEARTPHTITDPDRFLDELDAVRADGYAVDDEEEELGVRCVAVPVYGMARGALAMSVSGPPSRLDDHRITTLVPDLRRIAAAASDGA
jgi:IclR family transcriptional regulator, acetate operon repressor